MSANCLAMAFSFSLPALMHAWMVQPCLVQDCSLYLAQPSCLFLGSFRCAIRLNAQSVHSAASNWLLLRLVLNEDNDRMHDVTLLTDLRYTRRWGRAIDRETDRQGGTQTARFRRISSTYSVERIPTNFTSL